MVNEPDGFSGGDVDEETVLGGCIEGDAKVIGDMSQG